MPTRRRIPPPQNVNADGQKNVRDPSEHPLGTADTPAATTRRATTSGDDQMRLPHEHDETGDPQERAGGTDKLMEQAASDALGPQTDTDRRGDAVDVFNRNAGKRRRR